MTNDRQSGAAVVPPRREPNGRKKRIRAQDALNDAAERLRRAEMGTALAQPHRRGLSDPEAPLAGSAIGRFVLRHRLAMETYDAAQVYAAKKRRWLAIKGARVPGAPEGSSEDDPDTETIDKWRDEFRSIETAVASVVGRNALSLIEGAAIYEIDIPENDLVPDVRRGLVEMAYAVGRLARPK